MWTKKRHPCTGMTSDGAQARSALYFYLVLEGFFGEKDRWRNFETREDFLRSAEFLRFVDEILKDEFKPGSRLRWFLDKMLANLKETAMGLFLPMPGSPFESSTNIRRTTGWVGHLVQTVFRMTVQTRQLKRFITSGARVALTLICFIRREQAFIATPDPIRIAYTNCQVPIRHREWDQFCFFVWLVFNAAYQAIAWVF